MRELDVAVGILEDVAARALEHACAAAGKARRVLPGGDAAATGLDADQLDPRLFDEGVEDAHRVAAAADTGDDGVGQPSELFETSGRALPRRSPIGIRAPSAG